MPLVDKFATSDKPIRGLLPPDIESIIYRIQGRSCQGLCREETYSDLVAVVDGSEPGLEGDYFTRIRISKTIPTPNPQYWPILVIEEEGEEPRLNIRAAATQYSRHVHIVPGENDGARGEQLYYELDTKSGTLTEMKRRHPFSLGDCVGQKFDRGSFKLARVEKQELDKLLRYTADEWVKGATKLAGKRFFQQMKDPTDIGFGHGVEFHVREDGKPPILGIFVGDSGVVEICQFVPPFIRGLDGEFIYPVDRFRREEAMEIFRKNRIPVHDSLR